MPLTITDQPVDALTPRTTNPRTHSKAQIAQIAASIQRFGFTNPILVDEANGIIAGHGRVAAARKLGRTTVPTIRLAAMSEAEIRAYVIADNRLAEQAGWDRHLLGLELQYLTDLDIDLDVTLTGFSLPEIDVLIGELSLVPDTGKPDPADAVLAMPAGPAITQSGDVWTIGPHRLICGDATIAETYQRLLGTRRAQMVFTDPPYDVPIDGHVCGLGGVKHRKFAMAAGEMTEAAFTDFLTTVFRHLAAFSKDGALHFQCMDWRHIGEIMTAGRAAYTELKNLCVWTKTNGGMGSLYRSQHELVFVFKAGKAPHINNVELGKHGRYRTNVWSYAGVNSFGGQRDDLALHPTVKPVAMVADAIRDCSHRKGIVLDAFAGSGTTLVAAAQTGRRGYGIELDPLYCDVILRRVQDACAAEAVLEGTGQTFAAVSAVRQAEALTAPAQAVAAEGVAA
ncbi:ParB N-terminal domain-containing protein [Roseomonas sp. JC162]|uniref:Methyltransferase n=1 Tax=Neoroseomonas marina TaxID=1232220 RepID=A0A848EKG7_9PROT|nr:DNA methyltransferase [Neoroseomonas marina]NMJ44436.1 ParB N-terminal domain-containing protein [Neoroseomonas marina]